MSTIGLNVHLIPSALASSAATDSAVDTSVGSQLDASPSGTGNIVR